MKSFFKKLFEKNFRQKFVIQFSYVGAAIILPLYAYKVHIKTDYTDFWVYHRAAVRVVQELWTQIYNLGDGTSPFRYPPILLPLFAPFGHLELGHAILIWYFLQYLSLVAGFYLIYKTLLKILPGATECRGLAQWITACTFLFTLRFCLDTLTIGQVSGFMFLGYCLGLYGFTTERYFLSGAGLFIPAIFKIGPGVSYLLFLFSRSNEKIRAWLAPLFLTLGFTTLSLGWFGISALKTLIRDWIFIVSQDSNYYDASHYGSQSLKSVLLRFVNLGFLSPLQANAILVSTSIVVCIALVLFLMLRKPTTPKVRGIFFSLAVFPYLWFMPETFKYSLTTLALPIAFLLLAEKTSAVRSRFRLFALCFMFVGVSAAGKDYLPDIIFFGLQKISVPFLATLFLAIALVLEALRDSKTSAEVPNYALGPWLKLPKPESSKEISIITHIGDLGDIAKRATPEGHLKKLRSTLDASFGDNYEWICAYTLHAGDPENAKLLEKIRVLLPKAKLIPTDETGRSAALREGFLQSSGKILYLMRWEQPVGPEFLLDGLELIRKDSVSLVRGNRRLSQSRFEIPVKHLNVAYSRHRLGLLFNRLVRLFLPVITTTDTHSGHILMTRKAAIQVFALQTSRDFLFDLEIALTVKAHGFKEAELPVRLYLFEEKSNGRIFAEMISILTGLFLLSQRYKKGCYSPLVQSSGITADDWGLSPAVNEAILDLAQAGIIRRVSIMANCAYLEDGLQELCRIPGIQLGLHLNLTYGKPFTAEYEALPPLHFLIHWFLRKRRMLPLVRRELVAQLQAISNLGIHLNYLDGHHHIQIAPGLLHALANLIKQAGIQTVRLPYDPGLNFTKKFPLNLFSLFAREAVIRHGFKSMKVFYPQLLHFQDHGLLRAQMNNHPGAEVIVHPATRDDISTLEFPDSYTEGRVREFHALKMLSFLKVNS